MGISEVVSNDVLFFMWGQENYSLYKSIINKKWENTSNTTVYHATVITLAVLDLKEQAIWITYKVTQLTDTHYLVRPPLSQVVVQLQKSDDIVESLILGLYYD